ncbi:MAG: efflux RND transporter periplasmic adaptor subunit [Phycisphaerae bacterium]|nr:efflux RND transporter periplasmic adaptor subunit [Phycisphaerae bacterium]
MATAVAGPILLLAGCGKESPRVAPGPPEVTVSQPIQQMVTDYIKAQGTTEAIESVEIQARVAGWLEKINFIPRAKVKKDDLLFVIDPRPFKAKLDQTKADLATCKAKLELAEFNYNRLVKLKKEDFAADLETVQALSDRDAAKAAIAAAQAAVDQAALDLEYTQVRSPINGTVSRNLVDVGNLVGSGANTLLTTVLKEDQVYAYFDLSEIDLLPLARARAAKMATTASAPAKMDHPVSLALADETGYPHEGSIDFVETAVDPNTGTIRTRGVFPSENILLPGMFVRIRIPTGTPGPALMVAERALGIDQGQHYLLVINDKNVVEYRRVKVGLLEEGLRVIKEGIAPGDWVIVNGLQRVRPGITVSPQRVTMDKATGLATRPASTASRPTTSPASPARSGH